MTEEDIESAVEDVVETLREHPVFRDGTPAEALEVVEGVETDLAGIKAGLRDDIERGAGSR